MRLELPGTSFSAWIIVNDIETDIFEPEYSSDKDGPIAKCWIESKAGENFGVKWKDSSATKRSHTSLGDLYVDGVCCRGRYIGNKRNSKDTVCIDNVQTSFTTARLLEFSTLETTDAECGLSQAEAAKIGEIRIGIKYVETRVSKNKNFAERKKVSGLDNGEKVDERAKKAGSHRVQLGQEVVTKKPHYSHVTRTVAYVGTFIFNYRPREILLANEIIPRPVEEHKSPEPEPTTLTDSEEENLTSEISKLQAQLDDVRKNKKRRVKTEPDAEPHRVKREKLNISFAHGEVLDLTELSD